MKVSEIKSGVAIKDPDEMIKVLTRSVEDDQPPTSISKNDDGGVLIRRVTGLRMMEADDTLDVKDVDELRRLTESVKIPWRDEFAGRFVPYIGSDESVDSYGDIVRQNWIFDRFARNPIMPYSHAWTSLPIGAHVSWKVVNIKDAQRGYDGPALWLLGLFATEGDNPMAESVHRLVKGRFLRSSSVGFSPMTVIDVKDEDERKELGLGRFGFILDDNVLIEHSPTPIGANDGATSLLNSMKARKQLSPYDINVIRELNRVECNRMRGKGDTARWKDVDQFYRGVGRMIFPKCTFDPHKALDEPIIKAETKNEDTPPAPQSEPAAPATLESLADMIRDMSARSSEFQDNASFLLEELRERVEGLEERINLAADPTSGDHEDEIDSDSDSVSTIQSLSQRLERVGDHSIVG